MNDQQLVTNDIFNVPFKPRDGVKHDVLVENGGLMTGLYNVHNTMQKSYSEMCGFIAQLNSRKAWESYYDCKNINQLVLAVLQCSDGHASDLIKVAKRFYNSNGNINSRCLRYNFTMLRQLSKLTDDELESALSLLEQIEDGKFTRDHVKVLVDYIKEGKDASKMTVVNGVFTLPDNAESKSEEPKSEESKSEEPKSEEPKSEDNSDNSTSEKAESAEVKTESSPLTKQSVELIMNKLIKVRVDVDKLSKTNIKKQLSEIIEELGIISK